MVTESNDLEYPYTLHIKTPPAYDEDLPGVVQVPVTVNENGFHFHPHEKSKEYEIEKFKEDFSDLEKGIKKLIYWSKYLDRYQVTRSRTNIRPLNDPLAFTNEKILHLFNERMKSGHLKDGLYKFNRKAYPLSQSKYIHLDKEGTKIYSLAHTKDGLKGAGAFTKYKRLEGEGEEDNKVIGINVGSEPGYFREVNVENLTKSEKKLYKECDENAPIAKVRVFKSSARINAQSNYRNVYVAKPYEKSLDKITADELTIDERFQACLGMLQGIKFLYEKGYVHGDVKPDNFLVNVNELKGKKGASAVKVSDCGGVATVKEGVREQAHDKRYYGDDIFDRIWALPKIVDVGETKLSRKEFEYEYMHLCDMQALVKSMVELWEEYPEDPDKIENPEIRGFLEGILKLSKKLENFNFDNPQDPIEIQNHYDFLKENIQTLDHLIPDM